MPPPEDVCSNNPSYKCQNSDRPYHRQFWHEPGEAEFLSNQPEQSMQQVLARTVKEGIWKKYAKNYRKNADLQREISNFPRLHGYLEEEFESLEPTGEEGSLKKF